MANREFSITRTRAAFKPRVTPIDLPFFIDGDGKVLIGASGRRPAELSGTGRTAVAVPPYALMGAAGDDTPVLLQALETAPALDADSLALDYRIEGGFNNNAVTVTWNADGEHPVEWICLKTFTGFQLKYPLPGKRPRLVFALADEDAFAYCDKSPCEECGFRCKSGFVLYALVREKGIARLPLDRISTSEIIGAAR